MLDYINDQEIKTTTITTTTTTITSMTWIIFNAIKKQEEY
jgi:hypothetical protein